MANPTYRQWLQSLVNDGGGLPQQEANALLQVVGDDFNVNDQFEADPYAFTGTDRGQIFTTLNPTGSGENVGYGPQGVNSLNEIYRAKYNAKYAAAPSGGGGVDPEAQAQADEAAYWDDQLANADLQLGRLTGQEATLRRNAADSYKSAYDRLVGDKANTERDFNTTKTRAIEDNITAKGNINTSVRNRNTALQRLLGSRGAGNSSAAQILAPFAAAREGNQQRQQVQTAYGRNMQGLDTAWGDYNKEWDESAGDLAVQRDNAITQGVAGLRQTEADLLEAKGNAAVQRQQASGQSYTQARAARQPYSERIRQLIGQIDQAGVVKNFTPKTAAYKAPELSKYTYDRYAAPTVGSGVDPGQAQQAGAYWTLLGRDDRKKQQV